MDGFAWILVCSHAACLFAGAAAVLILGWVSVRSGPSAGGELEEITNHRSPPYDWELFEIGEIPGLKGPGVRAELELAEQLRQHRVKFDVTQWPCSGDRCRNHGQIWIDAKTALCADCFDEKYGPFEVVQQQEAKPA